MNLIRRKPEAQYTLGVYRSVSGLRGALVRRDVEGVAVVRLFGGPHGILERPLAETAPAGASFGESAAGSDGSFSHAMAGEGSFGQSAGGAGSFGQTAGGDGAFGGSAGGNGAFGLSVGGGDGSQDIFLSSEFGQIPMPAGPSASDASSSTASAFEESELRSMLAACRDEGIEDIEVIWSLDTTDVSWEESSVKSRRSRADSAAKKEAGERSVRIGMRSDTDGQRRSLIVSPLESEPASASIRALGPVDDVFTSSRIADSEISSLLASVLTARSAEEESADESTKTSLVVRIAEEDVLVLVLHGQELENIELLRSLSVHDGPEMIASRVLLLQDEYGLRRIDRLYLVPNGGDSLAADVFRSYLRAAEVISLRDELAKFVSTDQAIESEDLPAIGAGLRSALSLDPSENLLPEAIRRPRRRSPYSWEVWLMLGLLSITAIFFVGRFFHLHGEIDARHSRIEAMTHDEQTTDLLKQRIDSLQAAYSINMQGLAVLDSLLTGSDRWSRTFDGLASNMNDVGGVWIEKWQPAGSIVDITGRAASRDGVVDLARRLDGTIEEISYPTDDIPYYAFRMKMPADAKVPEAAVYLRERALQADAGVDPVQQEQVDANASAIASNH